MNPASTMLRKKLITRQLQRAGLYLQWRLGEDQIGAIVYAKCSVFVPIRWNLTGWCSFGTFKFHTPHVNNLSPQVLRFVTKGQRTQQISVWTNPKMYLLFIIISIVQLQSAGFNSNCQSWMKSFHTGLLASSQLIVNETQKLTVFVFATILWCQLLIFERQRLIRSFVIIAWYHISYRQAKSIQSSLLFFLKNKNTCAFDQNKAA